MVLTKKQLLPVIGLVVSLILLAILRFGEFELPFADDEDTIIQNKDHDEIIQDQQQIQQNPNNRHYSLTVDDQIVYHDPPISSSSHIVESKDKSKNVKIFLEV